MVIATKKRAIFFRKVGERTQKSYEIESAFALGAVSCDVNWSILSLRRSGDHHDIVKHVEGRKGGSKVA